MEDVTRFPSAGAPGGGRATRPRQGRGGGGDATATRARPRRGRRRGRTRRGRDRTQRAHRACRMLRASRAHRMWRIHGGLNVFSKHNRNQANERQPEACKKNDTRNHSAGGGNEQEERESRKRARTSRRPTQRPASATKKQPLRSGERRGAGNGNREPQRHGKRRARIEKREDAAEGRGTIRGEDGESEPKRTHGRGSVRRQCSPAVFAGSVCRQCLPAVFYVKHRRRHPRQRTRQATTTHQEPPDCFT